MPLVESSVSALNRRLFSRLSFRGPLVLRRVAEKEAFILAFICMADMYTTLFWVTLGYATEANDVLAWTFDSHPLTFVMVKSVSCVPAVLLAPMLARRHQVFTVWLLRTIIGCYVVAYLRLAQF